MRSDRHDPAKKSCRTSGRELEVPVTLAHAFFPREGHHSYGSTLGCNLDAVLQAYTAPNHQLNASTSRRSGQRRSEAFPAAGITCHRATTQSSLTSSH
jgi:hypothetical protein